MRSLLLAAALLFYASPSFAEFSGSWLGKGSCYLSPDMPQPASRCDYFIQFLSTAHQLTVRVCTTWHQEWGDGTGCAQTEYEIRYHRELWQVNTRFPFRAGFFSDKEIALDYTFEGASVKELFQISSDTLNYRLLQKDSGMEWNFKGELQRQF